MLQQKVKRCSPAQGRVRAVARIAGQGLGPTQIRRRQGCRLGIGARGRALGPIGKRRQGLGALRRMGGEVSAVEMQDFDDALEDSRATVTPRMEAEYRAMRGELKKRAVEAQPIGFFAPENLHKHKDNEGD